MAPERAVTLQDIADRLGITRSTVSYAITGRGRVSETTRRRVHEVAAELGYQPNTLARRLRASRTGVLALCIPRSAATMSYYMEATFGVVEEAEKTGVIVSMLPADAASARLAQVHADGIVLLDPTEEDSSARALLNGRIPVVTGEPVPPGLPRGCAEVTSDHTGAVAELMDHLAARGSRAPALILPHVRMHWSMTVRRAFETWCARRGIPARVVDMPHPPAADDVERTVAALLDGPPEPTDAIIATSDGTVLSVATCAQKLGRRIGEDLLVAAAVDSAVLELTHPSITAIDLHPREFGRRCVRALMTVLAADDPGEAGFVREDVPLTVRYRESTRGPVRHAA